MRAKTASPSLLAPVPVPALGVRRPRRRPRCSASRPRTPAPRPAHRPATAAVRRLTPAPGLRAASLEQPGDQSRGQAGDAGRRARANGRRLGPPVGARRHRSLLALADLNRRIAVGGREAVVDRVAPGARRTRRRRSRGRRPARRSALAGKLRRPLPSDLTTSTDGPQPVQRSLAATVLRESSGRPPRARPEPCRPGTELSPTVAQPPARALAGATSRTKTVASAVLMPLVQPIRRVPQPKRRLAGCARTRIPSRDDGRFRGDGHRQRHARLVLGRRPVPGGRGGRRARRAAGRGGRRPARRGRRVDPARRRSRFGRGGASPGAAGGGGPRRAGASRLDRHHQARGRPRGARRRRHARQRRLGLSLRPRARRPGGRAGGRLLSHAHARRAAHDAARPALRRRRERGEGLPRGAAGLRRRGRASPRSASGSTPASASARPSSTTSSCCAGSTRSSRSGGRWWSARRERASSAS